MEKKRSYQYIRLIATAMVVFFHYEIQLCNENKNFFKLLSAGKGWNMGAIGVVIFFILSGAVHKINYKENIDIKKYYKKRLISMIPAFYISYIIAAIVETILNPVFWQGKSIWKIILTILLCDGYFPQVKDTFYLVGEWFTTIILVIYLVFPILRKCLNRTPVATMSVLLLIDIFFISNIWNPLGITMESNIFHCLTMFSLGYITEGHRIINSKIVKVIISIGLLVAGHILVSRIAYVNYMYSSFIGIVLFFLFETIFDISKEPVFVQRTVGWAAGLTYMIYVTHHFCIRWIVGLFPATNKISGMIMFVVTGLAVLLFSEVVYFINKKIKEQIYEMSGN